MTKNNLKLSKKVKRIFTGTEIGALVEDFTSQVKLVAEDVSGLHNKFDRFEIKVDKIEADADVIKMDIEVIKMDLEVIKHDLKNKVSRDEFAVLERRVALLENRR